MACSKIKCVGPLWIRLGLGAVLIAHGAQKVLGLWGGAGLKPTVENLMGLGITQEMAYAVCIGELLAGLGVFFGCLTRISGLGAAIIMGGAIHLVHLKNGFFLNHVATPGQGNGIEYTVVLLAMGLSLLFSGPGILAVDNLLFGKKKECCSTSQTPPNASEGTA